MKKTYLLILLTIFSLVSCSTNEGKFDDDFSSICKTLKEKNDCIKLEKVDNSLYEYNFPYIDLSITAYYTKLQSDFSYAFVLSLNYKNTRIEGIRLLALSINDNNSTLAQVGFDKNKKIIDSYYDSSTYTYKGIQVFVTPFNKDTSITRFYFECASFNGLYYEIDNLNEVI